MSMPGWRSTAIWCGAMLIAISSAGIALSAQRMRMGSFFGAQAGLNGPRTIDGQFQFCRVAFRQAANGDGGNWSVDYPRADENLSTRLSELTKTPISRNLAGEPNHVLVRLTDAELFQCPFIMMTEVGSMYVDEAEAAALRDYLIKGGFLWADDFWGTYAWEFFEDQFRKVLPSGAFPIIDVPLDHPLFHTVLNVKKIPQIPSINWINTGTTSERGVDSAIPHVRAINDEHGRMMVLITHNTDFGDSWEREGDNHEYFLRFSVDGYAFGINALVYAMTH